jgi:hypothetical protein
VLYSATPTQEEVMPQDHPVNSIALFSAPMRHHLAENAAPDNPGYALFPIVHTQGKTSNLVGHLPVRAVYLPDMDLIEALDRAGELKLANEVVLNTVLA